MAISRNNNNIVKYSTEDMEFIDEMENRLTLFGQIPYNIPQKLIVSVIKQSAKWFYIHASATQKQTYFHINKNDILADNRMSGFSTCLIILPQRIRTIKEIHNASESARFDLGDAMYLSASSSVGESQGMYQSSIDNNLYIIEGVTKMVENRAMKNMVGAHVPFEYIVSSNELVLKCIPQNNILLDCSCDLELKYLYQYSFFYEHVLSKCRQELKRLLGGHIFNLPGDVVMNADEICAGYEDWKDIEISVKASNGLGEIIMKR